MKHSSVPKSARPVFVIEAEADDGRLINLYVERAGDIFFATFTDDGTTVYRRQYSGRNLRLLHDEIRPLLARPHVTAGAYTSIPEG